MTQLVGQPALQSLGLGRLRAPPCRADPGKLAAACTLAVIAELGPSAVQLPGGGRSYGDMTPASLEGSGTSRNMAWQGSPPVTKKTWVKHYFFKHIPDLLDETITKY